MQSKCTVGLRRHYEINLRMLERLSGLLLFLNFCFNITLIDIFILNVFYFLRD